MIDSTSLKAVCLDAFDLHRQEYLVRTKSTKREGVSLMGSE